MKRSIKVEVTRQTLQKVPKEEINNFLKRAAVKILLDLPDDLFWQVFKKEKFDPTEDVRFGEQFEDVPVQFIISVEI